MLEDRDVLRIEMILIAGDVAGCSAFYFAYRVREAVPDGLAFAVLVPCAFNLIRSGGHAPEKSIGKLDAALCGGCVGSGSLAEQKGGIYRKQSAAGSGEGALMNRRRSIPYLLCGCEANIAYMA